MEVEEERQRLAGVETAAKGSKILNRAGGRPRLGGNGKTGSCGLWCGALEARRSGDYRFGSQWSDSDGLDGWICDLPRSVARRALGMPGGSVYSSVVWVPPARVCYGDTPHDAMLTEAWFSPKVCVLSHRIFRDNVIG